MSRRNILLVLAWMTGAVLCFSATAVAVRLLAARLGAFEILTTRNAGGLLILLAALAARPALRTKLRPGPLGLHVVRNLAHYAGQYGWNYAVAVLPLATVFALEFTAPIWLAALAVPLLGERMNWSRAGAIVLGLAGVLVILRPGHESFQPAALVMLGAAIMFASVAVATKALTRQVSTFTILFWMNLLQLPLSLGLIDIGFVARMEMPQIIGAAMLSFGGLGAHLCLTQAYRYGDALVVMPLDFLRIPMIAVVGWYFYGEQLDPFVFAGAALIIGGIVWNLSSEARRRAPVAAVTASQTPG
ncbi:DMT family transporter [Enterovirga sp. CN4-39]|uniref:DMT family transporter n=1 Tax=Enterovirga sp. CN4-39 TaxID=3400910 RepID=UPI003C0E02B7